MLGEFTFCPTHRRAWSKYGGRGEEGGGSNLEEVNLGNDNVNLQDIKGAQRERKIE